METNGRIRRGRFCVRKNVQGRVSHIFDIAWASANMLLSHFLRCFFNFAGGSREGIKSIY